MHRFANPNRFLRLGRAILPWSAGLTVLCLASGLYLGLFVSPVDYQQGETVRIMYVHVPSAWMAMFVFSSIAIASAMALIWKHPLADLIGKASAPVGAGFTLICLVTGSLWGKPMWGTWWVWDARLTSVLILFSSISVISPLIMRLMIQFAARGIRRSGASRRGQFADH